MRARLCAWMHLCVVRVYACMYIEMYGRYINTVILVLCLSMMYMSDCVWAYACMRAYAREGTHSHICKRTHTRTRADRQTYARMLNNASMLYSSIMHRCIQHYTLQCRHTFIHAWLPPCKIVRYVIWSKNSEVREAWQVDDAKQTSKPRASHLEDSIHALAPPCLSEFCNNAHSSAGRGNRSG